MPSLDAYAPHWKFTMGGPLQVVDAPSAETWECNINGIDGVLAISDPDAWLADRASAVKTWFESSDAATGFYASLQYIKLNHIGTDGNYTDPAHPHTHDYGGSPGIGSATPAYPTIMSSCYSWTTSRLRGPGSAGRIFPPNQPPLSGAGRIRLSSTSQTNLVTAAKALLTALATTTAAGDFVPVVASKVDSSNTPITGVRVGDILDVQRRRKDAYVEHYLTSSWP